MTVTAHATAHYVIALWDEQVIEDESLRGLTRARVVKHFQGDLQGTSVGEYLLLAVETRDLIHSGFERFTGTVHGRTGSYVAQASAGHATLKAAFTVVEGAATDELRGMKGNAQLIVEPDGQNTFVLDYELA